MIKQVLMVSITILPIVRENKLLKKSSNEIKY